MEAQETTAQIIMKHVNEEAMLKELALKKVIPFLKAKAEETKTPLDDLLVAQLEMLAGK